MTARDTQAAVHRTPVKAGDLDAFFDREHDGHLEADLLQAVLVSLLAAYPEAPLAALSADGIMVEMPESIEVGSRTVLKARSGLDLIEHDDAVIEGWERVLTSGAGRYTAKVAGRPDISGLIYGLDLRERHGIVLTLSVFEAQHTPAGRAFAADPPDVKPRFATLRKDQRACIVGVDDAITKLLGWSGEEMLGRRSTEFIHPDDHPLAVDNWMEMLAFEGPGRRVRIRHRHRDGSWVWFEVTNHNLLGDPDYGCVVSEMVDITEEMAAHELLQGVAKAIPVGLFQVGPDRRIAYTNDRLHEILGVGPMESMAMQLSTVTQSDRLVLEEALDALFSEGRTADVEVEVRLTQTDELRFCTVSLRPLSKSQGTITGAIACVADITDSAYMREELKRRATYDELTGCYNRASIMRALELDIASGKRHAERAVMFVDLDGFKAINDTHGHATGDELLSVVGRRLREAVRNKDRVGRVGGDEFLVLCPDIGGPEEAMRLAERVTAALREEVPLAGAGIVQIVSVGVAWSSGEEIDADAMVALADAAMYSSKRETVGRPKLAAA